MANDLAIRNFDDVKMIAQAMAQSQLFSDARDTTKAMVKILAGQAFGLSPFVSMSGIHIIKGKPTLGANVIATMIKNDPRYDYKVIKLDNYGCKLEFFENGESVGFSEFLPQDADLAEISQKDNWRKYPRNMYFARAISNGARWYTPGIFGGAPVYTPEELGADIDEEGRVIDADIIDIDPTVISEVEERVEKIKVEQKQRQATIENVAQFIEMFSKQADFVFSPPAIRNRLMETGDEVDMPTVIAGMQLWESLQQEGDNDE